MLIDFFFLLDPIGCWSFLLNFQFSHYILQFQNFCLVLFNIYFILFYIFADFLIFFLYCFLVLLNCLSMFSCRSLSIFRMMILNSLQAVAGSPFLSEFSPWRFLYSFSRVTSLWFFPISVTLARCLWIWRSSMGWAWYGRSFTCRWVVLERAVSLVLQGSEHRDVWWHRIWGRTMSLGSGLWGPCHWELCDP